ncbi:uncharacterized protein LOC128674978 isoform X1 [Plodia interpunctella]|uniref:uncharacterized protein LOC128674978 isoform X1 n=1 Tax=Plodia interpunctella TaxID=58824 RepID=UPI00236826BD|nr:uncharacterized protein LOC128674978 isoform X1 [Plodia interpunctella]
MLTASQSSASNRSTKEEFEEDDDEYDEPEMHWSDIIFIPFNPIFQLVVLICVIHKSFLGPLEAVFDITNCTADMDANIITQGIKYFYSVFANGIYCLDTFLHIVHRQVTDKAVRKEHLPKSAFLILLDVLSLIPFEDMLAPDQCVIAFWPNILSFIEFVIIYRVVQYFELVSTHNYWKLYMGYTITFFISLNCLTCMLILLTIHGLCSNCGRTSDFYDWRIFARKENETASEKFIWYFYAYQYMLSFIIKFVFDLTKPLTLLEFLLACVLMICGYMFDSVLFLPKFFCEGLLSLRWISTFHPHVSKLVEETKRRNVSPTAYCSVESFYNLMWNQRCGIISTPEILSGLPRYLRIDIRQDLTWQVFYHSPTLRKTSSPFKRYISEIIRMDYKLPGARFFVGPHANTNLCYIKSGIVQFISTDDGMTPLLSVSGGTLFGDISFFIYPMKRKIYVKCLTYCELLYITRADFLKSLHRYPEDRKNVLKLAQEKIRHARTLYSCKQNIKGLDRSEDEGIEWLKRRWWEVSDSVDAYKKRSRISVQSEIPPEDSIYHCAKYIGQLVLCDDAQLKKKSIFLNDKFPWVLSSKSTFNHVWHIFVNIVVFIVLITFPPNLSRSQLPPWFITVKYFTDFVYIADICVSLCTSVSSNESARKDFASAMLLRCKECSFVMDVLAALWVENIALLIGTPQYYYIFQFNRLIKIYVLFPKVGRNWRIGEDHIFPVHLGIIIYYFSFLYIIANLVFVLVRLIERLSPEYFFGHFICDNPNLSYRDCYLESLQHILVAIRFIFEHALNEADPKCMLDISIRMLIAYHGYLLSIYCKSRFLAGMYLKFRERVSYQRFVTTLRNYYHHHTIHKSLLIRLERYIVCHWKYYHGVEVLRQNTLKDEPYDIYWKVQGEVAENIIGDSPLMDGADPALIRELACNVKYLIMPKSSTLFLFGVLCKNVTWIVQGSVKCEYHNENGEVMRRFYGPGDMISVAATIFERPSIRTYIALTDCEIIHMGIVEFQNITKRYPHEWGCLQSTIDEFSGALDSVNNTYFTRHADYQRKLRERIFSARKSLYAMQPSKPILPPKAQKRKKRKNIVDFESDLHVNPKSNFMKFWMPFRALTVALGIIAAALIGGGGVYYQWHLNFVKTLCTAISLMDVILKMFLAYYDDKGILVTARQKTITNYVTRGFTMDLIGLIPWDSVLKLLLSKSIPDGYLKLINTTTQFAHLYLLTGYFDYLADRPSTLGVLIKIAKWQLVIILLTLAGSHFLINSCVEFTFDSNDSVISVKKIDTCWLPTYVEMDPNPTDYQLKMLFAHSINLAQSGLSNINLGRFRIKQNGNLIVAINLSILGMTYWFVVAYSLTVLILISRTDTLFHHSVSQLRYFLNAERVDQKIIKRTMAHFSYWWIRTKGLNVHTLTFERLGVIFRQDLSYYFYKTTYSALDSLLEGGEQFQRQMSSQSLQMYFLSKSEIMKEKHLMPFIYVVHRGRVVVTQGGEKLAVLTKGAIFGQLTGTTPRPVKVSVYADGYADVLQLTIKQFNEQLTDDIKRKIKENPESQFDYLATKTVFYENPMNTIKYILRGRKTIRLPWMRSAKEAHRGNWYYRWLYVAWLLAPAGATCLTAIFFILPEEATSIEMYIGIMVIFDLIHLIHTIIQYYNLEIEIVGDKCVYNKVGLRLFKDWRLYVNLLSLMVPLLSLLFNSWVFRLARLLRLYQFYDFYKHFCRSFKSQWASIALKFLILTLLIHLMTCGWIHIACRERNFPISLPNITAAYNRSIDYDEWAMADQRKGGCARVTRHFKDPNTGEFIFTFIVPKHWAADYIVAFTFVILLHTHYALDCVMQLTVSQIYYKIFICFIINMIDIWLMSVAVSAVYTKFRELYQYDFSVITMSKYLEYSGLSPTLLRCVAEYCKQLWDRQRGNWLPELAHQAPHCLREEILGALYLHHILTPPIFRRLPDYFTSQLVARVGRVVIFPGNCIVQEGDINSVMYFIHEGEVEKWLNFQTTERKFLSLLSTNGYFGFVPGLFPNTRYQFTYTTRTVVDLVYLKLHDWTDLLASYPDIKVNLYTMARQVKAKRADEFRKEPSEAYIY